MARVIGTGDCLQPLDTAIDEIPNKTQKNNNSNKEGA
jgi:hypothetical protein